MFRAYLDQRHHDGGMADMTVLDYEMMVEDSHVDTRIVEYRRRDPDEPRGKLVGVALTDILSDGLSMVYSFFEPDEAARSLGTFMVLDHIARARRMGLPHVYLGYWIEDSRKMGYKSRFLPQQRLLASGWVRFGGNNPTEPQDCAPPDRPPSPGDHIGDELEVERDDHARDGDGHNANFTLTRQFFAR